MKELTIAAIVGALIGMAFVWAATIHDNRIEHDYAADVMAEWDQFEAERTR